MEPTTPARIRKTGLKREHTADPADSSGHGRPKRHRSEGPEPDSSQSRPCSIIPHQQEPYVPVRVLPGDDESRRLASLGRAHDTRGTPVNPTYLGAGNHLFPGVHRQSANYYPPHLSLHQHARHEHLDAPGGAHYGTARQESSPTLGLSQDARPPFFSHAAARGPAAGAYSAGGVLGPADEPQRSPEEPRASPDESSSPESTGAARVDEDSSPPVVPHGVAVLSVNSVRRGDLLPGLSNFQSRKRGAPSSDSSSEESSESEDDDSEDDAEGDSDELVLDRDDSSYLSQGEEADIDIDVDVDVEEEEEETEESSSEDGDCDQPSFENHTSGSGEASALYPSIEYYYDGVEIVVQTLQDSRLDDSDSESSSSSSSSGSSTSGQHQHQREQGGGLQFIDGSDGEDYDSDESLAEEIHRAEFAYNDDDDQAEAIREKYGPPTGERSSPDPDGSRGRRTLKPDERVDVKNTRHMGACVRCRLHKIKCNTDQDKPNGECASCQTIRNEAPKLTRILPCQRLKIADLVLYRCGGLNLTQRWKGIQMRDVSDRLDNTPITIEVSQGLCRKPLAMRVVRFKPRAGDVTARFWTDRVLGHETFKKKELASYCLQDIVATAEEVERYTIENAVPAFIDTLNEAMDKEKEFECIHRTNLMAVQHFMKLAGSGSKSADDVKEAGILLNLFTLWCAIRHTTSSFYVVGEEKMGMLPETEDTSYPLLGKISVPRMIVAQFDTLNYVWVLERYKNKLLRDVDWLLLQNKERWWFTLYLVFFILLCEASWITLDRYRHARANYGSKLRYSIPVFVESLHESCNNLLTHWHYRNRQKWPESLDPRAKEGTFLSHLTDEQYVHIQQTRRDPEVLKQLAVWDRYKKENGKVEKIQRPHDPNFVQYTGKQDKFDWDHPLYWVAQLFEDDWQPHPTYQREAVPKSAATNITR